MGGCLKWTAISVAVAIIGLAILGGLIPDEYIEPAPVKTENGGWPAGFEYNDPAAASPVFRAEMITRSEYGSTWPFRQDTLELACGQAQAISVRVPNHGRFGINIPGRAQWPHASTDNVIAPGFSERDLYPFIDRGVGLC